MTFNFLYILCVQEMLYMCNTVKTQSSFSSEKTEKPPEVQTSAENLFTMMILQFQLARMANEMSITQDFRTMTLNLPVNMVTVNSVVKTLKGQYTFCQNNNHNEMSFNPWSEDLHPTETFMRIVRETQIEPKRYYLETIMNQSLYDNFAVNSYRPKVTVVKQQTPQEDNDNNRQTQSPCPSNWSDCLHVEDDTNDENTEQTEQPTDQPTTLTGTQVPQDTQADANTIVRLPQTVPQALKIHKQNGKSKRNLTEAMPKVVVGNANPLWEQMPSPPKTRQPYMTWTWVKSQKQDDPEQK